MEHRPCPKLVLAGKMRVAKERGNFLPVDAVCFNEIRGNMETEHELHWTAGIGVVQDCAASSVGLDGKMDYANQRRTSRWSRRVGCPIL